MLSCLKNIKQQQQTPTMDPTSLVTNISLKTKTFAVKIENIDDSHIPWTIANFEVNDTIHQDSSKSAKVLYAIINDRIYLKAIVPFNKNEFEQIFGFSCGQFIKNRIISFSRSRVNIY
jgi:hypothetical protein